MMWAGKGRWGPAVAAAATAFLFASHDASAAPVHGRMTSIDRPAGETGSGSRSASPSAKTSKSKKKGAGRGGVVFGAGGSTPFLIRSFPKDTRHLSATAPRPFGEFWGSMELGYLTRGRWLFGVQADLAAKSTNGITTGPLAKVRLAVGHQFLPGRIHPFTTISAGVTALDAEGATLQSAASLMAGAGLAWDVYRSRSKVFALSFHAEGGGEAYKAEDLGLVPVVVSSAGLTASLRTTLTRSRRF